MSFSSDRPKKSANDILFKTLLTDPDKRAKVLELLMQEGLVEDNENASPNYFSPRKLYSPHAKLQRSDSGRNKGKVRLESPSALARRRALEKIESQSSSTDNEKTKLKSPPLVGTPLPFDQLLRGVVAYCEVRSNGQDRSAGIKTMMRAMGAKVCEQLNTGVTHIIFKDGLYSTFRKAQGLKVHVVSVLWLDAVRRHKFRVPEAKYRALGVDAYKQNSETRICQEMQKEFDDVVQDEYRRISQVKERRTEEFNNINNFVTQRRKTTANISSLVIASPSQDNNLNEEHMNTPDIGVPSKYICTTPALSESESCSSSEGPVHLSEKGDTNIVPCSQSASQSFTHDKEKHQHLQRVEEVVNTTEVEESVENIAKYVTDSFELKKAKQIKSPVQDSKNASNGTLSSSNKSVLTEDDSVNLHITITDESNRHSSLNKSKSFSNNAQSFLENENETKGKTVDETKDDSSENGINNFYFIEKDKDSIFSTVKPIKTYKGKRSSVSMPQTLIFGKPNEKTSAELIDNSDLISKDGSAVSKSKERRTTILSPQKLTFDDTDEEDESANKKPRRKTSVESIKKRVDKIIAAAKKPKGKRSSTFVPQTLMYEESDSDESVDIPVKKPRGKRAIMSLPAEKINEEPIEKETDENVTSTKKSRGRRTTLLVRQRNQETSEEEFADKGENISATKKNIFVPQKLVFEKVDEENDSEVPVEKISKEIDQEESQDKDRNDFPVKTNRERRTTMFVPQKLMFDKINEENKNEESENISATKSRGKRAVPSEKINDESDKEEEEVNENVSATNKLKGRRTTISVRQQNEEIAKESATTKNIANEKSVDSPAKKPRGRRATISVSIEKNHEINIESTEEADENVATVNKPRGRRTTLSIRQTEIVEKTDNNKDEKDSVKKNRRKTTMLVPQAVVDEKTNEEIDEEGSTNDNGTKYNVKRIRNRRTILSPQQPIIDELGGEINKTKSPLKEETSSVVEKPAAEEIKKPRVRKLFNVDQQLVDESLFNWDQMPKKNTTPPKKVQFYAMLPDGFPKTLSYKARTKLASVDKKKSNTVAKISSENSISIPVRRSAQHLQFDGDDKPEEVAIRVGKNNKKLETDSGIDGIVAIPSTSKTNHPFVVQKKGTKPAKKGNRLTSFESTASDSDDVTKSDLELEQNVSKPSRKSMRSTKTINYSVMFQDSQSSVEGSTNKSDNSSQSKIVQKKSKPVQVLENSGYSDETFVSTHNDVINSLPSTNSVIAKRKFRVKNIIPSTQDDSDVEEDDSFVTCNSDEGVVTTKTAKRKSDEMEGKIKATSNKKIATSLTSDSDTEDDSLPKRVTNKNKINGRLKSASTTYESTGSESITPTSKRTAKKVLVRSPRKPRNCSSVFKRPPTTPTNQKIIPQSPQTEPLRRIVPQTPQTEPNRRTNRKTPSSVFKKPSTSGSVNLTTPKISKKQVISAPQSESKVPTNRRSTLEFVQRPDKKELLKLTQKAKNVVKTLGGIVCTRFVEEDVHLFQQIVNKLGGFTIETSVTKRTTHLVAAAPSRTINLLRAIARGCWILKKEWLYKSLEEGKWLEEEDYEMTEFSPAVQKCRLEKQSFGARYCMDIFKDCGTIFVSRASSPRYADMEELIQLCGGRVVRIVRDADIIVGERSRNNENNAICVTEKWVLDSITYNKKKSFKHFIIDSPPQL